jgi:hypothetical protein
MYTYNNATATTINVVNQYHFVQGIFTGGTASKWTFMAGTEGSGNITTSGGGAAINIADVAHGLTTGQIVNIQSANHSGTVVATKVDDDNFTVPIAYVGDEVGYWQRGDALVARQDGVYKFAFSTSLTSAANLKIYTFELVHATNHIDESAAERKISTGTDIGSMGSNGIHEVFQGDCIALQVKNLSDTANLTLKHSNVSLIRVGP